MATASSKQAICSIVKDRTLELETKDGRKPDYYGVVKMGDMLIAVDGKAKNLQVNNGQDGKLITSHELDSSPMDVCLISKTEVAVSLFYGTVVILSLESIDNVKLVKPLVTGFESCHSLAKWNSDKLIVSGVKDGMLCWRILSIRDGRMDSTHDICKGYRTRMAVKDNTVYISCWTYDAINKGVYVYDLLNPKTKKFLYQHQELKSPLSIMADRDCVYVCDLKSDRIHQLTDSGQLVTIHRVSSSLDKTFYDDQHGLLYTTSCGSNVITVYKMESLHQPGTGIPVEILNMDDRSIQLFENALKDGKVKVYSIRVMVVGHQGVGKTTLIKRLHGEDGDMPKTDSTEGIDVHLHCCDVSLSSYEWTFRKEELEQDYRLQQLASVIIEKQQVRSEAADAKDVVIPHEGEITDISAQDHVAEEPNLVSPHPELVKTSQQVGSPVVLKNLPMSMVRSEYGANVSSESGMKDLNKEMLQLLQKKADKIKHDLIKYAPLSIWDFAGQYAFYTTHQMFLSRRAIYLLVSNISKHLDDMVDDDCCIDKEGKMKCRVRELLDVWMNSVHSCAPPDNESKKVIPPPIILVGTHADAIEQDNRHEICENYFGEIRSHLHDKPSRYHLVEEDFAINNKVVDRKLEGLKKKIVEVASRQPYWGEEIPASWLPLEQLLMNLRSQGHKVINRSLLENKNQAGGVQISTDQLDLFLRFQHEIGTIIYFSKELLKGKIVLVPQWMIKALKSLITAEMFVLRRAPSVAPMWYDFKNDGKLYPELIDALWTKDENADLHDNKEYILLLMEELNIIAKPKLYIDDASEIKEECYFLAPCMLQQKTPEEIISPKPNSEMESSPVLCYVFIGKFLPSAIFHRLVAACIAQWPVVKKKTEHRKENLIFCGCCVFQLDEQYKLTLLFREHVIFLRVTRMGIKDKTPSSKLCIEVREFITTNLNKIIGYLGKGLEFEYSIQCPEYNGVCINCLIPVSRLKEKAEVHCEFHDHMIESCKVLDFWFEDQEQTVIEGIEEGKRSKVSEKGEDASMDSVLSTSIKKEKLHETVLNRCLPSLMKDLNVRDVMMYIQQKELFDPVTTRDINEQTTTTKAISLLIDQIKKRDQDTYVKFKECLIQSRQADLKIMLDEEEENLAAEMKEKHRGAEASKVKSQMQAGAKKELDQPQTKVKIIDGQDKDDVDVPITQEHINHARLCNALTTVCSNALREILLANVPMPHKDIYKAILANKSQLNRLNQDQVQLVFPNPQGLFTGKVEEFDISLLYILVRNVSSVSAPTNGWGKPPADNPRDTTLGASVERIRLYRNDISGHSVDGKISQKEFEDYWAKIDLVLREIEIVIGNHGYLEDLEKRKNQAITPQEANELQKKFQEYKKQTEAAASDILSTLENVDLALETARQTVQKAKSTVVKTLRGNQN